MVITLVEQGYKFMKGQHDYKTGTGITYSRREQPIDIGKSNDNFKDKKLKYFNYNKYARIANKCWKKKEKETRKCFKYNKEEHIAKDCKEKQSMKKQKIQEELDNEEDNEENNKKKSFDEDLE